MSLRGLMIRCRDTAHSLPCHRLSGSVPRLDQSRPHRLVSIHAPLSVAATVPHGSRGQRHSTSSVRRVLYSNVHASCDSMASCQLDCEPAVEHGTENMIKFYIGIMHIYTEPYCLPRKAYTVQKSDESHRTIQSSAHDLHAAHESSGKNRHV